MIEHDANISGSTELGRDVACVIVQQPNFIGEIRDFSELAEHVHFAEAIAAYLSGSSPSSVAKNEPTIGASAT